MAGSLRTKETKYLPVFVRGHKSFCKSPPHPIFAPLPSLTPPQTSLNQALPSFVGAFVGPSSILRTMPLTPLCVKRFENSPTLWGPLVKHLREHRVAYSSPELVWKHLQPQQSDQYVKCRQLEGPRCQEEEEKELGKKVHSFSLFLVAQLDQVGPVRVVLLVYFRSLR